MRAGGVAAFAVSSNGRLVAIATGQTILIYDTRDYSLSRMFSGITVSFLEFSRDNYS